MTVFDEVLSVLRSRESDYGDAEDSFSRLAFLWSEFLRCRYGVDIVLSPRDIADMMVLFKSSRLVNSPKRDTVLDIVGYAVLGLSFTQGDDE
jgi:hypothetical protein